MRPLIRPSSDPHQALIINIINIELQQQRKMAARNWNKTLNNTVPFLCHLLEETAFVEIRVYYVAASRIMLNLYAKNPETSSDPRISDFTRIIILHIETK